MNKHQKKSNAANDNSNDIYICNEIAWDCYRNKNLPATLHIEVNKIHTIILGKKELKTAIKKLLEETFRTPVSSYDLSLKEKDEACCDFSVCLKNYIAL